MLFIIMSLIAFPVAIGLVIKNVQAKHLHRLATERKSSPGYLVSCSANHVGSDPVVVQAVYEAVENHVNSLCPGFPIHPDDDLVLVLGMDPEDVEDMVNEIANDCGRMFEENPEIPAMIIPTVSGVIDFVCKAKRAKNGDCEE